MHHRRRLPLPPGDLQRGQGHRLQAVLRGLRLPVPDDGPGGGLSPRDVRQRWGRRLYLLQPGCGGAVGWLGMDGGSAAAEFEREPCISCLLISVGCPERRCLHLHNGFQHGAAQTVFRGRTSATCC